MILIIINNEPFYYEEGICPALGDAYTAFYKSEVKMYKNWLGMIRAKQVDTYCFEIEDLSISNGYLSDEELNKTILEGYNAYLKTLERTSTTLHIKP